MMRYLPLTDADRSEMLSAIGAGSIDALFADVPEAARHPGLLDLPRAMGELEVERRLGAMAAKNLSAGSAPFFLGGGAYRHHVPAAVDHLIQRGEFLTSYTPYQPEVSQGTLQYLFEFQTQVALLTGMEVANASLYDGATACAEAVAMAGRVTRRDKAVLSGGLHPHYRAVCETYARFAGNRLAIQDAAPDGGEDLAALIDGDTSCVVVQNPDLYGEVRDYSALAEICHKAGRAARRRRDRNRVVGRDPAARRDGRRYRRRRRPVARQRAEFRRPLCRAVRDPRKIRAADAGAAGRRDRRCRRQARLGADPVDARAAYPPREGDEQYLHQFRSLRARLYDPSVIARRSGADPAGAAQPCAPRSRPPSGLPRSPACDWSTGAFSTNSRCACRARRRRSSRRWPETKILGGIPVSRFYPGRSDLADLLLVAATETVTEDDIDRLDAGLREV